MSDSFSKYPFQGGTVEQNKIQCSKKMSSTVINNYINKIYN